MTTDATTLNLPTCTATALDDYTVVIRAVEEDITSDDWAAAIALVGLSPDSTDYHFDLQYGDDDAYVYTLTRMES